jgi:predicted nucleic acid-binding protein
VAFYLDSSAIVKLVVAERGSSALRRLLRSDTVRVSSALALVEVVRAVRHHGKPAQDRARRVLARVRLLSVDHAVLEQAATLGDVVLRSLDAIHVASALALGDDLRAIVTYDLRMLAAAAALQLPVRSPGAPRRRRVKTTAPRALR